MTKEVLAQPAIFFTCPHCQADNFGNDSLEQVEFKDGLVVEDDVICCDTCQNDVHVVRRRELTSSEIYLVKLSAHGNPDHGENPGEPVASEKVLIVSSFAEASRVCRDYIEENGLGSGNWSGGAVHEVDTDVHVANVSYNGRCWSCGGTEIGIK